jgi:hypothetical protein
MKTKIVNSLSTAMVALLLSHVLHEITHLVVALATGAKVSRLNLFAVDITLFGEPSKVLADMAIEAGASIVNVIAGLTAVTLFHLLNQYRPLLKQLLLQIAAYNLLMGFGYFLFDALFYTPDMPGDWRSVITMLDGSIALRVALILIGTIGMLLTFFWLAKNVLVFAADREVQAERFAVAYPLLLLPYLVYGTLYCLLSLWHPLGFPTGIIITALQFFFGFSGMLWAFFLAVYWLKPSPNIRYYGELPATVSPAWVITAIFVLALKIFVLLPTINLG